MKLLIVVDMQNDFITGPLGAPVIREVVPKVVQRINDWTDQILVTRDTHGADFPDTQEGRLLGVVHGIEGTEGWQVAPEVQAALDAKGSAVSYVNKHSFGHLPLGDLLQNMNRKTPIEEITFIGIYTDVCVTSNVVIAKAALPEVPVIVDASCCASGYTPESHAAALLVMKSFQTIIINE